LSGPAWSVIVPTRNRPQRLALCLAALARLSPPPGGYEIIIVNDGGISPGGAAGETVRFIEQRHAGPAAARNHGAHAARGRWLAFTDDDCEPAPDWLLAFDRSLSLQPEALAGGTVANVVDSVFSEASQRLAGFVAAWFDGAGRERFFTSNNIASARATFLEAGGFDTGFGTAAGEDREFCDRWSAQGRPSILVADAYVRHAHALSLRGFVRQHFAYGRAAAIFRARRSDAGRPVRIEPGFYVASLRHAARAGSPLRASTLAACTLAAHAAYGAGLVAQSLRTGPQHSDRST
jgi:glycosyltransferase involved in cell wall biosynthesis